MTAEIAIMNRMAVALAADSAVTFGHPKQTKIYYTVNKLFTLSKYEPVGVMVYGDAELMGVPWETILKEYRRSLGRTSFNTLGDYARHLIDFMDKPNSLFPSSVQEEYFEYHCLLYLGLIDSEIHKEMEALDKQGKKVSKKQARNIISSKITHHAKRLESREKLPTVDRAYFSSTLKKYGHIIDQAINKIFEKAPLSVSSRAKLRKVCANLCYRDIFSGGEAGLVVAGFGSADAFPALESFAVESVINDRLKYKAKESQNISVKMTASIMPFAQSDMVSVFMEGVDLVYNRMTDGYLQRLFGKIPEYVEQLLSGGKKQLKQRHRKQLTNLVDELYRSTQRPRLTIAVNTILIQ